MFTAYGIIQIIFVLVLSTAALMLTQRSLTSLFSIYSGQSLLLAIVAVALFFNTGNATLLYISGLTVISKVIVIPYFMRRIQLDSRTRRDLEFSFLSPVSSILVRAGLMFVVYKSFSRVLPELAPDNVFFLGAVIGVSLVLIGMLIIFSRKKMITKVVGYLTMENGVLLFSLFIAELPFIIEILIIIDLIILILLSAILAFGIDSTITEFHRRLNPMSLWFKRQEK